MCRVDFDTASAGFDNLYDALDYAAMTVRSDDGGCTYELVGIIGDDELYTVRCSGCGDTMDVSPVVYYRYVGGRESFPSA